MHATFGKLIRGSTETATPTTVKGCRSFVGMVNFLSMFCPELQKLLKPIYNLTRKARPSFSHLLKRVDFDATVDHLSLMHIIKSKTEPAMTRIKRLLELISSYSFNLYYVKGKDMILSDFLSRQKNDGSNPHEIIPISFNMCTILDDNYYNIEKYLIQTRSQARSSGVKFLEVHGMGKNLDPNLKPKKQHAISKQGSMERPHMGQGRTGIRGKRPDPINQPINQPSNLSQKIPGRTEIETGKPNQVHSRDLMHSINNMSRKMTNNNSLIPDVPFHPGPVYRPPPKPIRHNMSNQKGSQSSPSTEDNNPNINPNSNLDLEKNSPIQRKVLGGTHLPVEIKEIQARYLQSSYFRDIYIYLSQNKLTSSKAVIRKIEALAEKCILLDSLLFKITPEKETAVLTVL